MARATFTLGSSLLGGPDWLGPFLHGSGTGEVRGIAYADIAVVNVEPRAVSVEPKAVNVEPRAVGSRFR